LKLYWELRRLNPSIIHACDLDTLLPALLLKSTRGTRVVYDIFDWYADTHPVGFLGSLVARLEQWGLRSADLVIVAHEARLRQLGGFRREGQEWQPRVCIIYNVPEVAQSLSSALVERLPPFVAYCGVLAHDRGLDFLRQATQLAETLLVVAGYGILETTFERLAREDSSVCYLGRVSHEEAMGIQAASLCVAALHNPKVRNNRLAAPNKLFEAMALGRPVITNEGTLAADIVREAECGLVVPYADAERLAEAVTTLRRNPSQASELGRNGLAAYRRGFSPEIMRHRLRDEYLRIMATLAPQSC